MERFESEMNYAVSLWDSDHPDAKKMTRIANMNQTLGQIHIGWVASFPQLEIPLPDFINPADHVAGYSH